MKRFIKNLENQYVGILILIIGILMLIFPDHLVKAFPWALGGGLILRGIAVLILAIRYKETSKGPGKMIVYVVLGLVIMILRNDAIGIIGVIWAVFSLEEVSADINEMWKDKHISVFHIITAIISVALAVMLIVDPFKHFVTHVRVLGLEIVASCLARCVDMIRSGINKNDKDIDQTEKEA